MFEHTIVLILNLYLQHLLCHAWHTVITYLHPQGRFVDAKIEEAVEVEAKKRHAVDKKLAIAKKQLRKTMEVLKRQTALVRSSSCPPFV